MLANFRKTFCPTPKELEEKKKWYESLEREYQEHCANIKLVPVDKNDILFASEPLSGFDKDCEHCMYYAKSPFNFVTGGDCAFHGIKGCWGLTCKNWRDVKGNENGKIY